MLKQFDIYKNDQYYEAIIQLRPSDREVISFIEDQIRKRGNVFISKVNLKKFGSDIYISSQKFARILGKKLKRAFNGEVKITYSLHSTDRQSSKKRYRCTVLLRLKEEGVAA